MARIAVLRVVIRITISGMRIRISADIEESGEVSDRVVLGSFSMPRVEASIEADDIMDNDETSKLGSVVGEISKSKFKYDIKRSD